MFYLDRRYVSIEFAWLHADLRRHNCNTKGKNSIILLDNLNVNLLSGRVGNSRDAVILMSFMNLQIRLKTITPSGADRHKQEGPR